MHAWCNVQCLLEYLKTNLYLILNLKEEIKHIIIFKLEDVKMVSLIN